MNYPNGITKNNIVKQAINYKNRGMNLEDDLNITNNYYIDKKKAYIYKKPTPIKLVKVNYQKGRIDEAYFEKPSTTDYNGLYNGYYIDFEAKETTNVKGFPLINIHKHQIEHINNMYLNKGICFLLIRFTKLNKTYLLMAKDFMDFINNNKQSLIPLTYIEEKGYLIKDKFAPRVDYLEIIDQIIERN